MEAHCWPEEEVDVVYEQVVLWVLEDGTLSEEDVERIDREATAEVEAAERFAEESPIPDPSVLDGALYAD